MIESVDLFGAVRTILPQRLEILLHEGAVVDCAADVFAQIHTHVLLRKSFACTVMPPKRTVL